MDYNDIEIRCAYGNRYHWLTPICKTLLACMVHKDWFAACAVYSRMSDRDRSVLLPLHRDLAAHLCFDNDAKRQREPSHKIETQWLNEVFDAWKHKQSEKANSILREHSKEIDKLSLYWIEHVGNSFVRAK